MASEPVTDPEEITEAPLTAQKRKRAEAIQRLQVGLSGLGAMLLLVSLANIIMDRAKQTEKDAVPDTARSAGLEPASTANKDPLVDAGVVPELPAEPVAVPGAGAAGANAPPPASRP
jgi:hypothetical protein